MAWKPCVAAAAQLVVAACGPGPKTASALSAAAAGPTINEIMSTVAEPSADALWQSVKTVGDSTGVHEIRPSTDADWERLRLAAQALKGAAILLPAPGRRVVADGVVIEAGGTLTAEQIQAKIAAEHPALIERAKALERVSDELLASINARDVDRFTMAGGALDEACEACHTAFYYPEPPAR